MFIRKLLLFFWFAVHAAHADEIRIAAASDLRFAMDEIINEFKAKNPSGRILVSYGSSGKFMSQIQNGAPYDLFFSADIALPRSLIESGFAEGKVHLYGIGRLVVWHPRSESPAWTIEDLIRQDIRRIAIANPKHAPYGMRAIEALQAAGLLNNVRAKLVYGENILQAAQFVQSGNAETGIIALSLALHPDFSTKGHHTLVPDALHLPLEQGFVLLKGAGKKPLAKGFADFVNESKARNILQRNGFSIP